jgi:hypothetical protein
MPRANDLRGIELRGRELRYNGEGERMERSESAGSGGMVVGRRLIEFGDYPEPVDYELARERVVRSWGERAREVAERKERMAAGASAGNAGVDPRTEEGVGLGIGINIGK